MLLWALTHPRNGAPRWHIVDRAPWLPRCLQKRCKAGPLRAERARLFLSMGLADAPDGAKCAKCLERA